MAPSTDEECGICLDALTNPVALPCRHKFCSNCLDSWRSKYGNVYSLHKGETTKTCPLCREKIPPSKEMVMQLEFMRRRKNEIEGVGGTTSVHYNACLREIKRLELEIGDWTEPLDSVDEQYMILPQPIYEATKAASFDIKKVLNWLGPPPVDKQRIDARSPEFMNNSLTFCALVGRNSGLISILLQFGADVNAVNALGHTALNVGSIEECDQQARLLLEWGAETDLEHVSTITKERSIRLAFEVGNVKLAQLLQSEFGGRRCELLNLSTRPDLNGKTCVVETYLPDKDRYTIVLEGSKEAALVRPTNLKRRDRTPTDCGYYITFNKGKFSRREFASKEECQAYVAEVSANSVAEKLAGVSIKPSHSSKGKRGKKGKTKGRK